MTVKPEELSDRDLMTRHGMLAERRDRAEAEMKAAQDDMDETEGMLNARGFRLHPSGGWIR